MPGSSVPIKFSLSGFRGLNLFATGYPATQAMTIVRRRPYRSSWCRSSIQDGFTYDPSLDQYKVRLEDGPQLARDAAS